MNNFEEDLKLFLEDWLYWAIENPKSCSRLGVEYKVCMGLCGSYVRFMHDYMKYPYGTISAASAMLTFKFESQGLHTATPFNYSAEDELQNRLQARYETERMKGTLHLNETRLKWVCSELGLNLAEVRAKLNPQPMLKTGYIFK